MTTPNTIAEFAEACKTLDNFDIYMMFEEYISDDLRNEIYALARPEEECNEVVRDALITIGMQYNVQSLIDY
jgi:hypothetical protein